MRYPAEQNRYGKATGAQRGLVIMTKVTFIKLLPCARHGAKEHRNNREESSEQGGGKTLNMRLWWPAHKILL